MRLASALWLCTVGCGFHGSNPGGGDDTPDAPEGCLGSGAWVVCPPAPPTATLALGNLDTGTDQDCITDAVGWGKHQDAACILVATEITVGSATITGPRPLVLVATGNITISTLLDVSSQLSAARKGPYTADTACTAGNGGVDTAGGGGAGGSFGGIGGLGGSVNSNNATRGAPGPIAQPPIDKLRGGCPGGKGGDGGAATGGKGGDAGGAVFLLAGGTITINGRINASGAGGNAGTNAKGGGGGGGSGGMIVLLSGGSISTMAGTQIFANGGGGGGGADANTNAMPGKDPTTPMTAAAGGDGGGGAGKPGGPGGFITTQAAQGVDAGGTGGGGGGGGGGVGVIRVISGGGLGPALVSPPPT